MASRSSAAGWSTSWDGRTHTVRTVNHRVFAFDRIVITIDRELPKGRRIQYNALHVKSYPEVER